MIVILYNVRSLHNVGSIFRTADAAGVEKIYLCGITPSPIDIFGKPQQQLTKVSLGAEKYVKWEKVISTTKLIDELKKEGYKVLAIEQGKKSAPYYKYKLGASGVMMHHNAPKMALVLGNEIKGLPSSVLNKADKILEIPMRGRKESLNVAVVFGIIVFHLINS